MMKVLALGDTHGKDIWTEIVQREEVDRVIFIGDYFDTHEDISPETQIANFLVIAQYKKENPDFVTLLLGNHDYHYLMDGVSYSGYQAKYAPEIKRLLLADLDHFQVCKEIDGVLYSHAGVSSVWQQDWVAYTAERINQLFKTSSQAFDFLSFSRTGKTSDRWPSPYGDDPYQGPMWIRPKSLGLNLGTLNVGTDEKPELYRPKQVVGHTMQDEIQIYKDQLALIDCLPKQYLVVEDGTFRVIDV